MKVSHARGNARSISKSQYLSRISAGVVWSNPSTEVSETAKTCSDEQKLDMRLYRLDEVAHHTEVQMCLESMQ